MRISDWSSDVCSSDLERRPAMTEAAALMVDVDGVLVTGRPRDGRPWATGLREDLGLDPAVLHRAFFAPHWHAVVTGRAPLRPALAAAATTRRSDERRVGKEWCGQCRSRGWPSP